ncbi:RNA polymerase sigma factor [Streptomyces pharetrae]|uniref:RNA polymerase sigma factor n=1 Tax=Streptomyces pharetrae TaxID=291370 RepID=UPI003664593F
MPSKPKGNAELLADCARGEPEAWDETVDRFGALVWTVARSQRVSRAEAEDVRQLTWFRLMQNAHRIRDPDRLGDWLATVARREAVKAAGRARRLVTIGDTETLEYLVDHRRGHHESPEQITLRADRDRELLRAIDTLSPQCRDVLLHALQDPPPSYQDLSAALAVPVGSIGPIRTRCLRRLRRALDAPAPAENPTRGCTGCPAATAEPAAPPPREGRGERRENPARPAPAQRPAPPAVMAAGGQPAPPPREGRGKPRENPARPAAARRAGPGLPGRATPTAAAARSAEYESEVRR